MGLCVGVWVGVCVCVGVHGCLCECLRKFVWASSLGSMRVCECVYMCVREAVVRQDQKQW